MDNAATGGTSIVSGLAGRYAQALYDLATEANVVDAVLGDLNSIAALLNESADFDKLVRSPLLSRDDQARAMAAILDKAGAEQLTKNFAGLLAAKRRLFALPDIINTFKAIVAHARGEVTAEVVSAQALTDAQIEALKDQLRSAMGREVQVSARVNPELIGGLTVKVGSRMIDASLATRLANMEQALKRAS